MRKRAAKKREKEFIQKQTQPQPDTKETGDTQSRQTLSPEGQKRLEKIYGIIDHRSLHTKVSNQRFFPHSMVFKIFENAVSKCGLISQKAPALII